MNMKYNCQTCDYKWEGNTDSFFEVLAHEKTHKKKSQVEREEF